MPKRKKQRPAILPVEQSANKKDQPRTREVISLASDLVLAVIPFVLAMPVIVRWLIWWVCFTAFVYIAQTFIPFLAKWRLIWRILVTGVFSLVFAGSLFPTVGYSQWREEKAAALEGDLTGAGPAVEDGKPHGFPMLQIGGTTFVMTPNGVRDIFPFFPDSGVRIEWGTKGWPLFTTTVRDHNGNLVAQVIRNHWRVYPSFSAEKNYTKDTLEVQDTAGHIVLQVQILPGEILLLGEWWDTQGNGIRLMKPSVATPNDAAHVIRMNRQTQHLDELIQPIFEYPSKDHWGELKK